MVREHKAYQDSAYVMGWVFSKEKNKRAELRRWKYWSLQQVLDTTIHSEKGKFHRPSELWHYRQKYINAVHMTALQFDSLKTGSVRNIFTVRKTFYQFISIFQELLLAQISNRFIVPGLKFSFKLISSKKHTAVIRFDS